MENYVFVCIGTNKLIYDSFGPRVGEFLIKNFPKDSKAKIFGTMQNPVHFKNATRFLKQLKKMKSSKIILIDSALGKKETIGNTYVNFGGVEIGKAFGKSFYFPAHLNIKTVVSYQDTIDEINQLAQEVAYKITQTIF